MDELKVKLLRDCIPNKSYKDNFEIICLGGGSIKAIQQLGALYYLENEGILEFKKIHTYIGTSAGSFICLLLSIGYTPLEILTKVNKIEKWMDYEVSDFFNFKNDRGLLDFSFFLKILENFINLKLKKIPTLLELYQLTGKKLIITTTNVSKKRTEYLDYISDPDLSCILAIKMSCSIPLIFKRVEYNNNYYVDGGLLDNFPIEYINDKKTKIVGVCVESIIKEGDDFINYIDNLFTMPILKIQNTILKEKITPNCLVINIMAKNSLSINNFNLDKNFKIEMFHEGYNQAEEKYFEWF